MAVNATSTAEPTITADRYRWTDQGRRNHGRGFRAAAGEEFYGLPTPDRRVRILFPSHAAYGQRIDVSRRDVEGAGLNPDDWRLDYVANGDVELVPMTLPTPVDQATYPDAGLAHLPLYRVTGAQDNFHGEVFEYHRDHLFRGVIGEGGQLSIIVPTAVTTAANRLSHMYGLSHATRIAAGIAEGYRKYSIRSGRYEEVQPGVVTVTAEPVPVKKMSKKELRAALEAEQEAHREDMRKVSTRLESEAVTRDWCATYDSVVNDLSRDLAVPLIPRRPKTRKTVSYRVTQPRADVLELHDDLTPEQIEQEAQAWARRNIHAEAIVSDVTVR